MWSADPITGLITACAIILPDKKLQSVTVDTIKKKMKRKDFAKGANREQIKDISDIGIELDKFFEIALEEMKKISIKIGL